MSALLEDTSLQALDFALLCEIRVAHTVVHRRRHGISRRVVESVDEPCGKPAAGWLRCRSCGRAQLSCCDHVDEVHAHPWMACHCGAVGPGAEQFPFEPLPPVRSAS